MIRTFDRFDPRRIKGNEYQKVKDLGFVFDDDEFSKYTLVGDNSDVYAIMCYKRYWEDNYMTFVLFSEDAPSIKARELKRFFWSMIKDLAAERIQTDSIDCHVLNKWHDFLGFKLEGKREKMIMGMDYNMWGMLKGRDF